MMKNSRLTKGEETRHRIARSAGALFEENGYFGTGTNDILKQSDVPKGSMYFHFPGGKEEVATHAIELMTDETSALLSEALAEASSPSDAVHMIIGYFCGRMTETGYRCGCPIATVGLELSGTQSPVLKACAAAYAHWTELLAVALSKHVKQEHADTLASRIFTIIQGSLLVSRITGNVAPMQDAEQLCTDLIALYTTT